MQRFWKECISVNFTVLPSKRFTGLYESIYFILIPIWKGLLIHGHLNFSKSNLGNLTKAETFNHRVRLNRVIKAHTI